VFESGASEWKVNRTLMHEFATPEQRAAAILKAVRGIKRGTFAS
jgi:hypothetical protein